INQFLQLLIKISTRWTSKPKNHILIHLVMSVKWFGPPSLFTTKTFKNHTKIG
ncbi:hypothetical protein CROQUDRAFT_38427, partial [Cronartium quercuum f. sp. fusiforme G11]